MTVTTAKRNDTTTTAFEGWSSWTLPGNHQSRNAPPSDDNTNQTRTKWLKLSCLWPLGPIKPTAAEPLQQHYEPRAAAFELLLLRSLNTSRIDHRPVLLVNVCVCVASLSVARDSDWRQLKPQYQPSWSTSRFPSAPPSLRWSCCSAAVSGNTTKHLLRLIYRVRRCV